MKKYLLLLFILLLPVAAFAMDQENIDNSKQALFSRGAGYWSKPSEEKKTDYFGKLTEQQSQREDWYNVSPYIAEFWCAISNAGFLYVGAKHNSPELVFAGLASIASHSIPKQWLLHVDKLGVAVVLLKFMREYKTIQKNPLLAAPLGIAGLINVTDMYLARKKGKTWPHVVWHLSAAALADVFLSYSKS